jgi:hypothetical protein
MAIYLTIKWLFGKNNFLKMDGEQGVGIHKPSFDCGRPKSKIKKNPYKRSTVGNSSHQSSTVSHEGTASRSKRRWMDHGIPSYGPEEYLVISFVSPKSAEHWCCDTWRSDEPISSL